MESMWDALVMVILSSLFANIPWPLYALLGLLVIAGLGLFVFALLHGERKVDLSVYIKRRFLFDTETELTLFRLLQDLYGDRFHIFAQVQYRQVVEVRKGLPHAEFRAALNRIDRK